MSTDQLKSRLIKCDGAKKENKEKVAVKLLAAKNRLCASLHGAGPFMRRSGSGENSRQDSWSIEMIL